MSVVVKYLSIHPCLHPFTDLNTTKYLHNVGRGSVELSTWPVRMRCRSLQESLANHSEGWQFTKYLYSSTPSEQG